MEPYDFAVATVAEAGALLLRAREKGFDTTSKGGNDRDLVTTVDTEVSEFIVSEIKKAFPTHRIYSEEGGGSEAGVDEQWVIDPIDGSANFSRGIPSFSVCIGLLKGGVPVVGAVYNPMTRELFSFKKGGGAFLNGNPIHVSSVTELRSAQVVFSPGSRNPELWDWAAASYRKMLEHTLKRSLFGASALDLCFIAAGRVDVGIYGALSTLDIASAIGILTEAGGEVVNEKGEPVSLTSSPQRVVMSNGPELTQAALTLIF